MNQNVVMPMHGPWAYLRLLQNWACLGPPELRRAGHSKTSRLPPPFASQGSQSWPGRTPTVRHDRDMQAMLRVLSLVELYSCRRFGPGASCSCFPGGCAQWVLPTLARAHVNGEAQHLQLATAGCLAPQNAPESVRAVCMEVQHPCLSAQTLSVSAISCAWSCRRRLMDWASVV